MPNPQALLHEICNAVGSLCFIYAVNEVHSLGSTKVIVTLKKRNLPNAQAHQGIFVN